MGYVSGREIAESESASVWDFGGYCSVTIDETY